MKASRTVSLTVVDDDSWHPTASRVMSARRLAAIRGCYLLGGLMALAGVLGLLYGFWTWGLWVAAAVPMLLGEQLERDGWRLAYQALGVATACAVRGLPVERGAPKGDA